MFTTVGQSPPLAPGRRWQAGLLSLAVEGGLLAAALALLAVPAAKSLEETAPAPIIVEFQAAPPAAAPTPPAPGRPRPARATKAASSAPSAASVAPPEAAPTPSPTEAPVATEAPAAATAGGGGEGGEGGEGGDGGEGGGEGIGEGGGGGGDYRAIHVSQAQLRHGVRPRVPAAFHSLGLTEASCTVRLFINTKGRVDRASPEVCPDLLVEAALDAARATTFAPLRDEAGVAWPAQFVIRYVFTSR